jgi:glycosyltransferase involved in cell wall biosynthesis
MTLGSGSPLKVMEAMAAGVPVVASERVAGMLDAGPGDGLMSAADPDVLAAQIIRVLTDADLRAKLRVRVLETARVRFDRAPAAALLEEVWTRAAGG